MIVHKWKIDVLLMHTILYLFPMNVGFVVFKGDTIVITVFSRNAPAVKSWLGVCPHSVRTRCTMVIPCGFSARFILGRNT